MRRWRRAWPVFCLSLAAQTAMAAGLPGIDSLRKSITGGTVDEAQQSQAATLLDTASADDATAKTLAAQLATLRAEAAAQPARMEQLRRALAIDNDEALRQWVARLPKDVDAETLERVLAQERSIVADLNAQVDSVGGELALLLSGPAQAASDIAALHRRAAELSVPLPRVEGEPAALSDARRVQRASELRRVQTELELRTLEQETAMRRQSLYELTIDELRHRQSQHIKRTEILQAEIVDLGRREIDSLITRLGERELQLAGEPGLLLQTATGNRALGNELLRQNEVLATDRLTLAANEQARDRMAGSLRDSRARLDLGGSNEQVGRWLWSERRRIESTAELQRRQDEIRGALADTRLRLVSLSEERRELGNVKAAASARVTAAPDFTDDDSAEPVSSEALVPLLEDRVTVLALLEPLLQRRIVALDQSEQALRTLVDDSHTLRQLLDRHLLWTASHPPIDGSWFGRLPDGFADLFKPTRYLTTLKLAQLEWQGRPLPWTAALLLVVALIELRRRAPARIVAEAGITRQIRRDTYLATARTLVWTVLAALPAPVALFLLGRFLQSAGEPGRFTESLGGAFISLTIPLLATQLLRWTAIERGLGHAHFRWLQSRRAALRRLVPGTALVVLPMYFVGQLALIRNLEISNDVEARIAIVIACATIAWSLWNALAPGRIWVVRGVDLEPSRLRKTLRVVLPPATLLVALLALSGYVYSAGYVVNALLATFAMLVCLAIALGLLGRWLLLGERRLAWHRLEERRAAAAAAAAAEASGEGPEALAEVETEELTLEQINAQTGRLMQVLRLTLVAAGLIWVWVDLLPAFARLDEVVLWLVDETGPDGAKISAPVTLMGVLLGVFALSLTLVGARNLPGLIEIGLLSKTHIDAPSRYAITSILRYVIVIAGTVIGFGLLGLRWSQLQWMAAALTVGLGFGLQEIFANFVSGLILLFERPFRVGDVITIGELSGRVTRIRTRATTILDFENKEIVVPNKSFITGQLINWTLTDTTTRVTIKVGVDYGSDPRKVLDLLNEAARQNELVLADPPPLAWFLAFGANSLDFELRVFVADLGDRLVVQNDLNTWISEQFTEQGINIAFPQLDVHIRDLPAELRPAAASADVAAPPATHSPGSPAADAPS